MDLRMPQGPANWSLLRARAPNLKVICVSGYPVGADLSLTQTSPSPSKSKVREVLDAPA